MSERGTIAIDRGLFGHERFADEPFTEREAWIWMIGQAAFRPHCKRVGSVRVSLRRGEFAHSIRFMAERWKWSPTTVRRFLDRLGSEIEGDGALIGTRSDTGITVVSIRTYDDYQSRLFESGEANGAENGAAAAQQRPKEEALDEEVVVGGEGQAALDLKPEDLDLARAALVAMDAPATGRRVKVVAYQAAMWREQAIPRAEILATFADISDKAEKFPLSYYIAAVTNRHRRKRERPPPADQPHLPLSPVIVSSTEPAHGQNPGSSTATDWKGSRDAFRVARAEFKAGIAAAELDADRGGEGDGQAVRLAAAAGRG